MCILHVCVGGAVWGLLDLNGFVLNQTNVFFPPPFLPPFFPSLFPPPNVLPSPLPAFCLLSSRNQHRPMIFIVPSPAEPPLAQNAGPHVTTPTAQTSVTNGNTSHHV